MCLPGATSMFRPDGNTGLSVTISSIPGSGTLQFFNGTAWTNVGVGQVVSQASIEAGNLKFVPLRNESGTDNYGGNGVGNQQADYAQFKFSRMTAPTASSSSTTTNVQSDGSVAGGTGSKTSGLIYLEAGKTYTFSGTADDSFVSPSAQDCGHCHLGAGGQVSGTFTPNTSGYYPIEVYHANQAGQAAMT
uniref:Uncharacterized protein n=1 Tax=Ditylenchus dipsaci TaxID=166011 RepID=A0A915DRL8_9BILA